MSIQIYECQETTAFETREATCHKLKQNYQGVITTFLISTCNLELVYSLPKFQSNSSESCQKYWVPYFLLKKGWDALILEWELPKVSVVNKLQCTKKYGQETDSDPIPLRTLIQWMQ